MKPLPLLPFVINNGFNSNITSLAILCGTLDVSIILITCLYTFITEE